MNNHVELVGTYGGDETHCLSAWTSTSRELTEEKRARIPQFLAQLAQAGHTSVFEKSTLHFLVTCDIATHIQLLKHRVGVSVNAESARYKELRDDKFYVPQDWPDWAREKLVRFMGDALNKYHDCIEELVADGIPRKRAKETARYYLPYANQIVQDVSFNFRSFAHFVGLRKTEHAQVEICELATEMVRLVAETGNFDASLAAFGMIARGGFSQ